MSSMSNLIAFVNAFLSYFLLFAFIVVLCLIAAFIGIKLRKNKDLKQSAATESGQADQV